MSKKLPKGVRIVGQPKNDSIPEYTFVFEGMYNHNIFYSLEEIDSVVGVYLKEKNIITDYIVYSINPQTESIINQSKKVHLKGFDFGQIKSTIIPTRLDRTDGMQLILNNPHQYYIERMGLLLISTLIIMLLVAGCIIYQINIVKQLRRILKVREEFTYALIHDMKTPLTSILSATRFLHDGLLNSKPEMKEKFFQIAEDQITHLLRLTNKVLTIAKLESHTLQMNRSEVQLAPVIQKLTEKFTAKSNKPVHFTTDLKVPAVLVDAEYIEEVLNNLIDNSIKYSKESVEIKITTEEEGNYHVIRVRDNGMGIPTKDLAKVFNKYERSAAGYRIRQGGPSGFGLGLNFVQQIVEAHGGRIIALSIEGEFSEFIIHLPKVIEKAEL